MEIAAIIISSVCLLLNVIIIAVVLKKGGGLPAEEVKRITGEAAAEQGVQLKKDIAESTQASVKLAAEMSANAQQSGFKAQNEAIKQMNDSVVAMLRQFEERLKTLETTNEQKLTAMRETMSNQLTELRGANDKRLAEIQKTVDEKLEDRMTKSFQAVSERLEQVYKGLGEMQTLASGVGDLKKVLSNVKTRGILGEIQLGAILEEILAPEQYEYNAQVVPGSHERVEYAVKLPGEDGGSVWLPIDSKFPADAYIQLRDAYDSGSKEQIDAAAGVLTGRIKGFAKDIRDKYIQPPYTTNFGVMFLPFEGLYAEVVNRGMVEVLQREFNVNIAGPSTMAALLNSLQMGFRTLAIQKRSSEVWQILGAVKSEFDKFEDILSAAQKRILSVGDDLDKLVGVRSRAISRKLREVEKLDGDTAVKLLELDQDTRSGD